MDTVYHENCNIALILSALIHYCLIWLTSYHKLSLWSL